MASKKKETSIDWNKHPFWKSLKEPVPSNVFEYYLKENKFILFTYNNYTIPIIEETFKQMNSEWDGNRLAAIERKKYADFMKKKGVKLKSDFDHLAKYRVTSSHFYLMFTHYVIGFNDGYKNDFKHSTFDSDEATKVRVLKAIHIQEKYVGIPVTTSKDGESFYSDKVLYEVGYTFGKNFKAWSIVFEAPELFVKDLILQNPKEDKEYPSQKKKNKINQPRKLEDIFTVGSFQFCYNALLNAGDVLNEQGVYTAGERKKQSVAAWIHVCRLKGKLSVTDSETIAQILSTDIEGYSITSRSLDENNNQRTITNKTYKKYYTTFLNSIK